MKTMNGRQKWILFQWLKRAGFWPERSRTSVLNDGLVMEALVKHTGRNGWDRAQVDEFVDALVEKDSSLRTGSMKREAKAAIGEVQAVPVPMPSARELLKVQRKMMKKKRENVQAQRTLLQIVAPVALPKHDAAYNVDDYHLFMRSEAWRGLRYLALRIYGNKCKACGRGAEDNIKIHVDHIRPCSLDWSRRLDLLNLQVLCEDCNLGKSNLFQDDWRAA